MSRRWNETVQLTKRQFWLVVVIVSIVLYAAYLVLIFYVIHDANLLSFFVLVVVIILQIITINITRLMTKPDERPKLFWSA
jgi:uncharacterized membrane protein HdeD (DUF308 family)